MRDDAPSGVAEGTRIEEAVGFLRSRISDVPAVAIVLGSGMAQLIRMVVEPLELSFEQVPHWPSPQVEGHRGKLVIGKLAGVSVACLAGRVHLYEGHRPAEVVRAVRSLCHLGVKSFVLTNAAGAIAGNLEPGDLMVVTDHINLTGSSPLTGPPETMLGPRFPDQSEVYSPRLRRLLARDGGLVEGVYAGMSGPAYETPAEVRMLRTLGASAVGMSTVHEATALHAMGVDLAAVSLIANRAAGLAETALSHAEVLEASRAALGDLTKLLSDFCSRL